MEERKISFNRNDDPTIVQDPTGKIEKEVSKAFQNLHLNLKFCYDQLKEGKLTEGMKETHLSLTESYVLDFLKAMNYDSQLERQKEDRFKQVRSLNEENRLLREQLGEKVSNEDAREKLKNLSKSFRKWWNIEGFGHCSEIKFGEYGGFEANLSGMITDGYYADDRISTEDKIKALQEKGFLVSEEKEVVCSDANLELLKEILTGKYPSCNILSVKSYHGRHKNIYRDIELVISNLDDLV